MEGWGAFSEVLTHVKLLAENAEEDEAECNQEHGINHPLDALNKCSHDYL